MLLRTFVLLSILQISQCVDLTYTVDEGKGPNTLVGDIAADTQNWQIFMPRHQNQLTFNLLQGENSELFHISRETGKLYTTKEIDAENLCEYYVECSKMIEVVVQKDDVTIKVLEVKIIIKDMNDHGPEFPDKQVHIELDEASRKGETKSIPNAIDRDVGKGNSQIQYRLKENRGDPFELIVSKNFDGSDKLEISLKDKLDREIKDSYSIQVIATDGGSPPKQSVLNVHISITDINDNPPVFSQNIYNVTITKEQSKILPLIRLFATDSDSGENGRITYHFGFQTSAMLKRHFELKESTGEIFLRKDFSQEQRSTYKLYVKATDGGNPPLSSRALVLVHTINEQNNPPIIKVNIFSSSTKNVAEISEDTKIGSFIAYVKVTDNDPGQNGEVKCEMKHDKFQLRNLGSEKYEVIVKKALDRETEAKHEIIISCQDKGSPPLQSKNKFSIKVTDVNDVRPQFSMETFEFFIQENQKSRLSVGFINATDPDLGLGGKLTYSLLTNSKQFLPFVIDDDGMISTVMSLDHEFQNIYNFKVSVKDNGTPSLNNTVNVIVEVIDENDNAPYFTFPSMNPYDLDVLYYPHHTKNITQIKASDNDKQENAFLKYEIIRGNSKQIFTINQYTGLLSSTRVLSLQDAGSYELEFLVKDSGSPVLSARTTVYLKLIASNKTLGKLDAVKMEKDDKIHLSSAILIVSVSVMVAVIITVLISVCILQCNRQRNVAYNRKPDHLPNTLIYEQKHLIGPSYHGNTWHHVPPHMATDQYKHNNGCFSCLQKDTSDSSSDATLQTTSGENSESCSFMSPDFHTWKSSERSWSERETDIYFSKYCVPPRNTQYIFEDPATFNTSTLSKNQHKSSQHNPNSRPLPPVPQSFA